MCTCVLMVGRHVAVTCSLDHSLSLSLSPSLPPSLPPFISTLTHIDEPYPMLVLCGPPGSAKGMYSQSLVEEFPSFFGLGYVCVCFYYMYMWILVVV